MIEEKRGSDKGSQLLPQGYLAGHRPVDERQGLPPPEHVAPVGVEVAESTRFFSDRRQALLPQLPQAAQLFPFTLGEGPLQRALVLSWDHRVYISVLEAFAEILRNRSPAFAHRALPGPIDVEQIPELVDRGRHRYRASLALINEELGDSPFLCGDSLTFADISLLVAIETGSWVKESLPEDCTALRDWLQRCHAILD